MRLRTRLLLSVTAVTAAVLLASFIPLYVLISATETRDLDHALFRHAYAAAQRISQSSAPGRRLDEGWVRVPEGLEPTARYLAVYGSDGQMVAGDHGRNRKPASGNLKPTEIFTATVISKDSDSIRIFRSCCVVREKFTSIDNSCSCQTNVRRNV